MFFQRILAWLALAAGAVAAGHGIVTGRLFTEPVWSHEGLAAVAVFTSVYALGVGLLAWLAPRWAVPVLAALVAVYSVLATGPVAVASVLLVLAAAYVTGQYLLRRSPPGNPPAALTVFGLAVWIVALLVLARFPIHHWSVCLGLFVLVSAWAWSRQALQAPDVAWPRDRDSVINLALVALPLLAHWLVALKPEVDPRALGVHLAAPARIAAHHLWPFDVQQFAWAVKPMGGEWTFTLAYLIGGEAGARLLNVALLGLLCWLLFGWLHDLLPGRLAALLTAVFASLPIVHRMTGALRVDNVAALLLTGAVFYYRHYLKSRGTAHACAAALLAGTAAAVSLSALVFLAVFLVAATVTASWRTLLRIIPLALGAGAFPYLEAWWRTGNPVFPYLNHWFRSPLFDDTRPLPVSAGFEPLAFGSWRQVVFESSRFLEGMNGSFGVVLFLLAPLCVLAVRGNWPRIAWVLLGLWLAGFAGLAAVGAPAEALYPGLPLLTLSAGVMTATFRRHSHALVAVLAALFAAGLATQMYLLPVAAPEHRDFALNQVLRSASVDEYLARWAPERRIVEELNRKAPGAHVVWLESNAVAGFAGQVSSNTWRQQSFERRLAEASSAQGVQLVMTEAKVSYLIAPASENAPPLKDLFMREFLELYTTPEFRFANWELRRFISPESGQPPLRAAFAPPGKHDEAAPYVRFEGPWRRGLDFPHALRGTLVYTNDVRARVYIRFEGRAITPIFTAAANRCEALLKLDDGEDTAWPQYAPRAAWQSFGPRLEASPGQHTLAIRLPQSGDVSKVTNPCYLDLDGFLVE